MKIQTSDLKKLSEKLFDYIIDSGHDFVNISNDFYWHIDKTKIYNPYGEPNLSDCTLGQLSDDWHNLEKILNNENEPIGIAFVWLASIMRTIGEEIP